MTINNSMNADFHIKPGDWPVLQFFFERVLDEELEGTLVQEAVEQGAHGGIGEGARLAVYLPREIPEDNLRSIIDSVIAEAVVLNNPVQTWHLEGLEDAPWATAWKVDFKTFALGRRLMIRPEWERSTPAPLTDADRRLTIWLNPGMGFGTGRHETTRQALEALERLLREGDDFLDFGSGSGVLSIAAWRLGARRVVAIECDSESNRNAMENFELNHCSARIELVESAHPAPELGSFDRISCNMLPQHALTHFKALSRCLKNLESRLIYSGFLTDQSREIEEALDGAGLCVIERGALHEWGLFVCARRR